MENCFFDYIYTFKPNEVKVFLYIIRHTIGWQQTKFKTNYTKIGCEIGILRNNAKEAIKSLESKGIIEIKSSYGHEFYIIFDSKKAKEIAINACG